MEGRKEKLDDADGNTNTTDITSPPARKPRSNNAFDMLMMNSSSNQKKRKLRPESSSSEKKPSIASRFVPCPAGCGRHILSHSINAHLDGCLASSQQRRQQQQQAEEEIPTKKDDSNVNESQTPGPVIRTSATTISQQDDANICSPGNDNHQNTSKAGSQNDPEQSISSSAPDDKEDDKDEGTTTKNNVFAHMMKKSAQVFSADHLSNKPSTPKLIQRMHLHENGNTVSVTCYESAPSRDLIQELQQQQLQNTNLGRIAWSATIQVRRNQDMDVPVELTVSSSIPSISSSSPDAADYRPRFVQKHSRLSVPVLKSILQKSIRRRKPLPSVRVAMELADKSLGDLLRRLPIIILEDSTLHPDMPLLVWLMMASSKDYQIPMKLMKKVFAIVYEMASCPWKDSLTQPKDDGEANNTSPLSIAWFQTHSPKNNNQLVQLAGNDVILWSILMRGNYGGMSGDIRMLKAYAKSWQVRIKTRDIPEAVRKRLTGGKTSPPLHSWSQVPYFIHQGPSKHSSARIDALVVSCWGQGGEPATTIGIESLSLSDVTTEGVDFHCSSVLKTAILDHSTVVQDCLEYLQQHVALPSITGNPIPNSLESRRELLEGVLKSCMWDFSAGINRRLPLEAPENKNVKAEAEKNRLKQFWDLKVQPRTKAFSERYVSDRLAK